MRVVLIGATGLIGAALHAALAAQGHFVIATFHRGSPPAGPGHTEWRRCDMARFSVENWRDLLGGADAVINCAGVLQDNLWDSTAEVHALGVQRLVAAAEKAHLFRFIHFSAIGADRHEASAFSRSKRAGEQVVIQSLLDWIILRPCVVVGPRAFGASALFRGLAALPLLPVMPGTGPLQIVQIQDVVATVLHFLSPASTARRALDLAGPERLAMPDVVAAYRRWLGWRPAQLWRLPQSLAAVLYQLGDLARSLGWRPPLGSTARREMRHGAVGDPAPWSAATGLVPMRLEDALAQAPASVQERWFAALYMLKPAGLVVFSLFWIVTGIISLTWGFDTGLVLMREGGASALSAPLVISGALADITVGLAIALRRSARTGLLAAFFLTLFYLAAGTVLTPRLWGEPLGPLVKIFPLLIFNLMLLAILEER